MAADDYKIACGRRLRVIRRALGYQSMREFAKVTGVTEDALGSWERGRNLVTPPYVETLRARFRVSHDWVFAGDASNLPHALATVVLSAALERATGGEVTQHELQPDLYPPDEAAAFRGRPGRRG